MFTLILKYEAWISLTNTKIRRELLTVFFAINVFGSKEIPGVHTLADDLENVTKNLCVDFRDHM
jgi:hypothetical protein